MNLKIKPQHLFNHPTKREGLYKFLMLLFVLLAYFGYLAWEYGFATGGLVAALTWSFFVLCTPIADAGFLLDFPVRIITGIRMFLCEIMVWGLAIIVNVIALNVSPESYEATFITSLFFKILTTPWPFWSIIVLCGLGTFLSVRFGDELLDVMSHKDRGLHHAHGFKYNLLAMGGLLFIIVVAYYHLIATLGVEVPLP